MTTGEFFTYPDSLRSFTSEHLESATYFTALYLAKGKERIDISLEELMVVSID